MYLISLSFNVNACALVQFAPCGLLYLYFIEWSLPRDEVLWMKY